MLRAFHLAHPRVVTRLALFFLILFVEIVLFSGINGMVDDLLVSFVATVAAPNAALAPSSTCLPLGASSRV